MCKDLNENILQDDDSLEESYKTITVDIVSKVAYLLGVEKRIFEQDNCPFSLKLSIYDELEKIDSAKIIRTLCIIRYKTILNFNKINQRISYDMKSLNDMDDILDVEYFKFLESKGIHIVKANHKLVDYVVDLNKLIVERINKCSELFPLWVEWDYIKNLFVMPKGTNKVNIKSESNKYINNLSRYPFQVYVSWSVHEKCNMLYNDRKFLDLLYSHHGKVFNDFKKVHDAPVSTKKSIYNFLEENGDTVVVVDCENSDPYKLCGTIKSLNEDLLHKIKKVILINDVHTSIAWSVLEKLISIPVEYLLVERVNNNKSLVDIRVSTETCREHYVNKINSFILCSSDSDYWGLITSLPEADFLVMMEDKKCGASIKEALDTNGITYCSMDNFTDGNINDIKVSILKSQIKEYIDSHVKLNVNDMLEHCYTVTRIDMSDSEKAQFYSNYVKKMRLVINKDGNVEIVLK